MPATATSAAPSIAALLRRPEMTDQPSKLLDALAEGLSSSVCNGHPEASERSYRLIFSFPTMEAMHRAQDAYVRSILSRPTQPQIEPDVIQADRDLLISLRGFGVDSALAHSVNMGWSYTEQVRAIAAHRHAVATGPAPSQESPICHPITGEPL